MGYVQKTKLLSFTSLLLFSANTINAEQAAVITALEEVIVTAQKREQIAQKVPIAVAALDEYQLDYRGITSIANLIDGVVPSLRINPHGNNASTLIATIRGNGPTDIAQVTREVSVPFYLDGIYLGRSQGLSTELIDLQRIEVLRGPQGTLFGRNSTGGAVSLISKKPTGEFGIKQRLGVGRFDERRSITRVNLPEVLGFKTKFDYFYSERDGWVNNTADDERDYHESRKGGGQISISWQAIETLNVDYAYNDSTVEDTQPYFQVYQDNLGLIGNERKRVTRSRFPVSPLDPTITDIETHSITVNWQISDSLTIKSLSSYRELQEDGNNNYAGALYLRGLIANEDIKQEQITQEIQLIGNNDNLEWVTGFYYFNENVEQTTRLFTTLDATLAPTPPTSLAPPSIVEADAESIAAYGQGTWSFDKRLHLTLGFRYTEDQKSGTRFQLGKQSFNVDNEHLDPMITLSYDWTDDISSYAKWSTAYKAGGVNIRSVTFASYDKEDIETLELGLKSEFFDRRLRLNTAVFTSDYDDMQFDFINPNFIIANETINAQKTVEVDGFELDVSVIPRPGLVLGISYTYLDGDLPPQPNPLSPAMIQHFGMTQTPTHSGSFTADYTFTPQQFGTPSAHIDVFSTDNFALVSNPNTRLDAYTIANARLTLSDIKTNETDGKCNIAVWVKNLFDEEYLTVGFTAGNPINAVTQAFGTPRTAGIDVEFIF